MLTVAEPFLERHMHPTVIVNAYHRALDYALEICERNAVDVDLNDREQMRSLIKSSIGTKFVNRYGNLISDLALDSVLRVAVDDNGRKEIDTKLYAKIEKV